MAAIRKRMDKLSAAAGAAPVVPRRVPFVLPMQRQTVASMTLEAMRERILHGVYPEGEPLRQDAIAEELGVSRIPIREALRQLQAVLSHEPPPEERAVKDLGQAVKGLKAEAAQRQARFEESLKAERMKKNLLDKKFQEALKRTKDQPVGKPIRDIDLD